MRKKQLLATLVMLSLMQGSVYAKEFIGLGDDDLIQYDSRNDQFINHETNKVIHVENIDGLRTFETTFEKPIEDYDINFGQWTEVHDFPFDKAIINLQEDMTLTNGNHLWVIDTDQIVEFNFAEGKEIYGEFDPNEYYGNGIITPDNTVGFTLNVDAIRLKVLDGYMEDQCGAIATRGNGWAQSMEPNSGTYINTKLLDIVSDNYTSSPDKTAIFVYNNLFNINTDTLKIYSTNEQTRFGNGIISANSQSNITANTISVDAETAIIAQDPMKSGVPSNLNITANSITLNGAVQAYGGNLTFVRDENRDSQKLTIKVDGTDAVTANTPDYPDEVAEKNQAILTFNINTVISSQGDDTTYANKSGKRTASAIRAMRNSVYNLNAADQKYEIYGDIIAGRGEETSEIIGGKVNIGGTGSIIRGDVLAGNTGEININLNNGSIEGRVDDYADASLSDDPNEEDVVFRPGEFDVDVTKGGTVNMTLNKSNWDARGQSFVTELTFENGGSVNLVDVTETDGSGVHGNSVTIRNLKGDGTFNMTLNSADHSLGDMLYIGKNEGKQTINIVGGITGGLENISKDNPLRFATVGIDSISDVPEVNNSGIKAYTRDAGFADIEYYVDKKVFDKNDNENEKYNGSGKGETVDKPGNDFVENELVGERKDAVNWIITGAKELGEGGSQVSDAGKTIINMSRANYNNAIYMDRLNKRMGEARYINGEEDEGMWVRLRHDRIGKDEQFRSQNTMYEVGYDQKQECDNGERRIGMAIDYMDGKTSYTGIAGDGDIKRYGLWLYDTWLGNKGHYVDYVAKWGHLENDFDIMAKSTGEKITGDYSNNVFSISAEYGRKKEMGNDWYFEPQAQVQLARVTGADYETSQGTKVSVDGINSLIGRAGFRLGKDFGTKKQNTVYLKADVLHEFLGEQDMYVRDNTFNGSQTFENEGTWYDVGFGFAAKMSKNSYAFMDFEKSFGNDNEETYQINVGMQWSF